MKKLLMITRKVDRTDALAGFAYGWVKKIGQNVEALDVICLERGDLTSLPENIKIYSLAKEKGVKRFLRLLKFQFLALRLVPRASGIFCHMNPEYTIAIAPYAKLFRKKIVSWYTHGKVTLKMKIMEKLADVILTASKESFRLPSKKVKITGHGIETEFFKPSAAPYVSKFYLEGRSLGIFENFHLLSIGRISPTKNYETLILALDQLINQENKKNIICKIIGGPGLKNQQTYFYNLKQMVKNLSLETKIEFIGPVSNFETVRYYQDVDLFVNLSGTGSVDKTVLEAMSCGTLVLTSNEAFTQILGKNFMVEKNNPAELVEKIKWVMNLPEEQKEDIKEKLRTKVVAHHNLDNLVKKIISEF